MIVWAIKFGAKNLFAIASAEVPDNTGGSGCSHNCGGAGVRTVLAGARVNRNAQRLTDSHTIAGEFVLHF